MKAPPFARLGEVQGDESATCGPIPLLGNVAGPKFVRHDVTRVARTRPTPKMTVVDKTRSPREKPPILSRAIALIPPQEDDRRQDEHGDLGGGAQPGQAAAQGHTQCCRLQFTVTMVVMLCWANRGQTNGRP